MARAGLTVAEYTPSAVKMAVTGTGDAAKAQVQHLVARRLGLVEAPSPADAADALAIAILLLGHTLNLMLGIMGGVVHGLRLNCIEFFKWSLPEEGYSFTAFAKKGNEA